LHLHTNKCFSVN